MSERTARRLSWSIAVASIFLVMTGLALSIYALIASEKGVTFSHQYFTPFLTITYSVVGALVASRHPRNPIGWIFCTIGFLSAANMLSAGCALYGELVMPFPGVALARWFSIWIWIPNVLLPITFTLLLFPDGKLMSARWRPVAWAAGLGIAAFTFAIAFHPGPLKEMGLNSSNPYGLSGSEAALGALMTTAAPLLLAGILGSIVSLFVQFRRAVGIERTQLKWLTAAGVFVVVGNILGGIPWLIWRDNPATQEFSIIVTDFTIVGVVLATGIAILRYQLWDIHIFVNRTLVYGSLTAIVVALYIVVVGSIGMVLQTGGSLPVSLLGTGIVAVSFQPLRQRLQRAVNRLMYGERDDPYAVLGRLSERLEALAASKSVLAVIVETVVDAFKLPYAAIALRSGDELIVAAEQIRSQGFVRSSGEMDSFPLIYQTEAIGALIAAPRAPGEQFSATDRRLLETIARQAGVAAYNVRLTQDLQRSRERLVSTREEERRRLRRDLHDGLGPVLASMSFKLDAAYNFSDHNSNAVRTLVTELKAQIQDVLADIRRIAYDLRPPALDELGLVGALKQHIASQDQAQGLQITLEAPENHPPLPAAVEVAVYRIVLEAVTNVNRHAGARHCQVRLSLPSDLCVEITDDGQGMPNVIRAGVGLISMRERAEELGGTCYARSAPAGGTSVVAHLPLAFENALVT